MNIAEALAGKLLNYKILQDLLLVGGWRGSKLESMLPNKFLIFGCEPIETFWGFCGISRVKITIATNVWK